MARTTGFDHVATVTADLDRIVAFYQQVFDAQVTFEMTATPAHPRMVILDLDDMRQRLAAAAADVGQVQRLGGTWSLFFRDPDGMELEVCTPIERWPSAAHWWRWRSSLAPAVAVPQKPAWLRGTRP